MGVKIVVTNYIVNLEVVEVLRTKKYYVEKIEKLKEEIDKLRDDRIEALANEIKSLKKQANAHEKMIVSNYKSLTDIEDIMGKTDNKQENKKVEEEIDKVVYG